MTTTTDGPTCLTRRITAGGGLGVVLAAATVATAGPAHAEDYVVQPGDTVSHIALRTSATVSQIVAANGLDARATIRAGQVLTIPQAEAATPQTTTRTHTVVRGDTVWALARTYGSTVSAITDANRLDARATIRIGQQLSIPGGSSAQATGLVGDTFAGRTYPAATVASANENKATLLAMNLPTPNQMQATVVQVAREMGVDPALAQAIAHQESGFNQAAVSPANAIGTMQVIPSSGEWASQIVGRHLDLLDPHDNVVAGVAIIGRLVATSDDLPTAIASYYQGQRSVRVNGMFADTRRYVANVQTLMSRYA